VFCNALLQNCLVAALGQTAIKKVQMEWVTQSSTAIISRWHK